MFGSYDGEIASRRYHLDFSSVPIHLSIFIYNEAKNNNNLQKMPDNSTTRQQRGAGPAVYPISYHHDVNFCSICLTRRTFDNFAVRCNCWRIKYISVQKTSGFTIQLGRTRTLKHPNPHYQKPNTMDAVPVSNKTAGEPESTYNSALETGAGMTQVNPCHYTITLSTPLTVSAELCSSQASMRPPQRLPCIRPRPEARRRRSKPLLCPCKRLGPAMYPLRLTRTGCTYHWHW